MGKKKKGSRQNNKQNIEKNFEDVSVTKTLIKAFTFGALFLPLVFFPPLYDIYDLSKITLLRLITIIITCLWVWHILSTQKIELPRTKMAFPALIFIVILLISTIFSVNPMQSIIGGIKRHEGFPTLFSYIMVFWLASTYFRHREASKVETLIGVATIIVSIYGIAQRLEYDIINFQGSGYDITRAFASTGNPVFLGQYLALTTPFLIAQIFFLDEVSTGRKVFRIIAAGLAIACSAFTYSRAGWIGIFVAVLIALPLMIKKILKNWKYFILIFAIVGIAITFVHSIPSATSGKTPGTFLERVDVKGAVEAGTGGTRLSMWRSSLRIIKEKPLIGYGLETFKGIFPRYRELILIKIEGEMSMPDRPHNEPLYHIYSFGILGYTAFLWILVAYLWKSIKYLLNKDSVYKSFVFAVLLAVIGYNVADFFSFSTGNSTPTYYLLLGFAFSLMGEKSRYIFLPKPSIQLKYVTISLVVLWAIVFSWLSLRVPIADLNYNKARFDRAYSGQFKSAELLNKAREEGETAIRLNPFQSLYRIELAQIYQDLATTTGDSSWVMKNYDLFNEGVEYDPRDQDSWINMASVLMGSNSNLSTEGIDKTVNYLNEALKLDPYFTLANERLARIYMSQGRNDLAKPRLAKLLEVQPSSSFGLTALAKVYEIENRKEEAKNLYNTAIAVDPNNQEAKDGLSRIK